jgi:hypothetical protein
LKILKLAIKNQLSTKINLNLPPIYSMLQAKVTFHKIKKRSIIRGLKMTQGPFKTALV